MHAQILRHVMLYYIVCHPPTLFIGHRGRQQKNHVYYIPHVYIARLKKNKNRKIEICNNNHGHIFNTYRLPSLNVLFANY